jgi:hypothetical protein
VRVPLDRVRPNPWRDMGRYPPDEARVEQIKASIKDSGFWDNVVVRESPTEPGMYQLAYGHTRIEAARRAGVTEIDVPVRELSDEQMLAMMVNENATIYGHGTQTNNHAVAQAAKFIARELLKAEALGGWEWLTSGHLSRGSIFSFVDSEKSYRAAIAGLEKGELPGHSVIGRFMEAHGQPLSEREVRAALAAHKGTELERDVLKEAAAWAAEQAKAVRAEQARAEEEACRAAEEAERRRIVAEARARKAEEQRKAAEARQATAAEQRRLAEEEVRARAEEQRTAEEARRQQEAAEAEEHKTRLAAERATKARAAAAAAAAKAEAPPEYDRVAIELFERAPDHAQVFRHALEHHRVPYDRQRACAEFVLAGLTDLAKPSASGQASKHASREDRLTSDNIRREVQLFSLRGCDLERACEVRERERRLRQERQERTGVVSVETELTRLRNHLAGGVAAAQQLGQIFAQHPDLVDYGDFQWRECASEYDALGHALKAIVPRRHRLGGTVA